MSTPTIAFGETVTETWLNGVGTQLDANTAAIAALPPSVVAVYAATLANVVNTSSETTALSFTIPADAMSNGDRIIATLVALIQNNKGTSGTATFKVNVGAGVQVTVGAPTADDDAAEYYAQFQFQLQRVGSTVMVASGTSQSFAGNPWSGRSVLYSSPANFTSDNLVSLKVTLDAADASFYFKPQSAKVEHVKS